MAIEFLHALLLGTSLLANIILCGYVLSRRLKSLAAVYYFFFMVSVIVHIAGDLFFQLSTNIRDALFWMNLYWIGFFFMTMCFFYFASVFPRNRHIMFNREYAKLILLVIPIWLTYMILSSNDYIHQILLSGTQVNAIAYGPLYLIGVTYISFFLGMGLVKLYWDYLHADFKSEKESIKLVFSGIFIGAFFGIVGDTFFIRILGLGELKLASIFIFITCIIISYVTVKHKIFSITPVSEESTTKKAPENVAIGESYFIDEKSKGRKKAFRIFSESVRHNRQGLVISTDHPNQIREKYLLEKTPIIWLSDSIELKKENIKPNEIEALNNTVLLFMDRATNPIILLHGIKKLLIVNGSRKTTELLRSIIDKSKTKGATFLVSVSDEEKEFISVFNEAKSIEDTIKDLEKRLLLRKISNQTHDELLAESWEALAEKEAEMKMIEEEQIGKISGINSLERELIIKKKSMEIIKYYSAKRQFDSSVSKTIINSLNKKIVHLENEILKN